VPATNKAKKKMFGNERGQRTLKGSERCRTMTALQEAGGGLIFGLAIQGDHHCGRAHHATSPAKHSFVDLCSLIERACSSRIGPSAIILAVFRLPTCGR
jgi:hypothetical protein